MTAASRQAQVEREQLLAREQSAQAEAEAAVRLRDEFLVIAAHELKTPLTSRLASAQLLSRRLERESPIDTEASRQRLRIIEEQARRMSRLVAQLLDVSRIQFGRLVLELEEVDLARLVASSAKAIQATTCWEDMAVHVSEVPVPVRVDPLRIEQVVTNLIDNAIKFSPDRGRIEVEVAAPNARIACLSVRDYGIGIPPDKRGRIFDRFHQAHASEHRSGRDSACTSAVRSWKGTAG